MNIKNYKKLSLFRFPAALYLLIIYLPIVASCQSKELTRAQAQKMIVAADEYRQVVTLDYINLDLKEDGWGTGEATAADETEASAVQNRINGYYNEEPRVQVANYLGLVEPHIKRVADQPKKSSSLTKFGFWFFDEKWANTAKGEKLWADYNLPVQETTVPLAKREFVQITGITKIDDVQQGVDFTWRWVPNALGTALDPSTAEFKALPDVMQKNLVIKRAYAKESFTYTWSGDRPGRALFRKYDNGWRMEWVRL